MSESTLVQVLEFSLSLLLERPLDKDSLTTLKEIFEVDKVSCVNLIHIRDNLSSIGNLIKFFILIVGYKISLLND